MYTSRGLRFPLIADELNNLLGKVLTIMDASIVDKAQCKAIKDLIRDRFGVTVHDNFRHYCFEKSFEPYSPYYHVNVIQSVMEFDQVASPTPPPMGHSMPEVPE